MDIDSLVPSAFDSNWEQVNHLELLKEQERIGEGANLLCGKDKCVNCESLRAYFFMLVLHQYDIIIS